MPPWGLGLSAQVNGRTHLLHDGRARNMLKAVLWHVGKPYGVRDGFARLAPQNPAALIAFVTTL